MNERGELMERFERVQGLVSKRMAGDDCRAELMESFGAITLHQVSALRHLVDEKTLTMNELASRMEVGPSSATQLVDRLVQHGLVERSSDPLDRRVLRVSATEKATKAVKKFKSSRRRQVAELFDRLSDSELKTFISLAERMVPDSSAPSRKTA